jgi:outer membrane murein-binding lipoprotein Lpp
LEDSYSTEKRKLISQLQQLQNESKQLTSKLKIKADHVTRVEEERDDINRRYKEQHMKHSEDVSRYMRKIEQLQATEDALRQRTASIVQKRMRSASVLSSSSQNKVEGAIIQKSREQLIAGIDNTANQNKQTEDGEGGDTIDGVTISNSTSTQDGRQGSLSPASDMLSSSLPMGSAPGPMTDTMVDIENRLRRKDEEDELLYAIQEMREVDVARNDSSLSEELSRGEEATLNSPQVEQIKHLMSEHQLLESERQQLSSERGALTLQVEELQNDVVKLRTEIQMKEANEQVLEQCIEHLKSELRKYKETERKLSLEEADLAKKKGVLRYTKTELDSVLRQYHFYKEKCHDLQDELQRARSAALASAHRQQSGIRKLLSRLFSKLSGSSSTSPRRADRTPS